MFKKIFMLILVFLFALTCNSFAGTYRAVIKKDYSCLRDNSCEGYKSSDISTCYFPSSIKSEELENTLPFKVKIILRQKDNKYNGPYSSHEFMFFIYDVENGFDVGSLFGFYKESNLKYSRSERISFNLSGSDQINYYINFLTQEQKDSLPSIDRIKACFVLSSYVSDRITITDFRKEAYLSNPNLNLQDNCYITITDFKKKKKLKYKK